ncbi:TfoX/Sxy family protein [Iodobacter fluviatilis]|uniref:DNA transformation protein n=1 Tax=Iodobacter fluviatilis TaxID=537 RepID=A0A377SW84_9NEIS|nr:TfoX/Sxy family protein [Iodobacter fluviatilis]TCU88118.1 DNA transformation protein [Iodobacter fluviatilis]STR45618.1 Regulator of competence-specific genes [Iodobacter fluviatilis]
MQQKISDLANLGPQSQAMLEAAGICSVQAIYDLGSVQVYLQVKKINPKASLNLLYALEGAISGLPWQTIAKEHKTSLLLALENSEKQIGIITNTKE